MTLGARLVTCRHRLIKCSRRSIEAAPAREKGTNVKRDPNQRPCGLKHPDPTHLLVIEQLPDDKVESNSHNAINTFEQQEAVNGIGNKVRALRTSFDADRVEKSMVQPMPRDRKTDEDQQADDAGGDEIVDVKIRLEGEVEAALDVGL